MTVKNFDACNLHIPNKEWARDIPNITDETVNSDRENWSAIERWVNDRFPNCGCACYYEAYEGNVTNTSPNKTWTHLGPLTSVGRIGDAADPDGIGIWTYKNDWGGSTVPVVLNEVRIFSPFGSGSIDAYCFPAISTDTSGVGFQNLQITSEPTSLTFVPDPWVWHNHGSDMNVGISAFVYSLCGCKASALRFPPY